MTTIAYKAGIIAYDSRTTRGNIIIQDDFEKSFILHDGSIAFRAGSPADDKYLIENWGTCSFESSDNSVPDIHAFVVDPSGVLWRTAFDSDGNWYKEVIPSNRPCDSIGSGMQYALAAMDMGATAKKAIEIASKRDLFTGGKINIFEITNKSDVVI